MHAEVLTVGCADDKIGGKRHLADGEAAQAGVGDTVGVGRLLQAVLLADLGADGLSHVPGARSMSKTSGPVHKTAHNTARKTAAQAHSCYMPLTRQESAQHAVRTATCEDRQCIYPLYAAAHHCRQKHEDR